MNLIPDYPETGPLTVCPCCGAPVNNCQSSCVACVRRLKAQFDSRFIPPTRGNATLERLEWARIGIELRLAGKLPPLTCATRELEPTRWGGGGWLTSAKLAPDGRGPLFIASRDAAVLYAGECAADALKRGSDAVYTVKPYPGPAENTSEANFRPHSRAGAPLETETAPPAGVTAALRRSADAGAMGSGSNPEQGGAAKVDSYAAKRESDERTRSQAEADLVTARAEVARLETMLRQM